MIDFRQRLFAFIAPLSRSSLMAASACAQSCAGRPNPHKDADASMTTSSSPIRAMLTLTELDATPTAGYLPKAIARNVAAGQESFSHRLDRKGLHRSTCTAFIPTEPTPI